MTFGQKLKKIRIEKNLTQKELADELHVTFQTVSKWESDTNEPDLGTLKSLSKILDCSMDQLLSEDETEGLEEKPVEEAETETPVMEEAHICERCHKPIPENELMEIKSSRLEKEPGSGRRNRYHSVPITLYYHKECHEQLKEEELQKRIVANQKKIKKAKKLSFGLGITAGLVALGISLGIFLGATKVNPAVGIIVSIIISYAIFADLYCIISGSYIGDIFVSVSGWSIKFPGLIFSWDLEGFAWLIAMKILFAILGFFIGIFVLALAIALSAAFASVSFPFVLIHNIRTDYDDAITETHYGSGHHRRGGRR